jgi:hypothetical protein
MPKLSHRHLAGSLIALGLCLLWTRGVCGQGFDKAGVMKTKITLHRKLPPVVHFTGTTIDTKVTAREAKYSDIAGTLNDQLQTELLKNNERFRVDSKSPEMVITCTVNSADIPAQIPPPPQQYYSRVQTILQKGKQVQVTTYYFRVTGLLDLSYKAVDRSGRALDADNVSEKYSEEFVAGTNENTGQSLSDKFEKPFKKMAGKKTDDSGGLLTVAELRAKLIHDAIHEIVPRITTTNEPVDVLLARGKMDEANKSAEGGLWTRYLEQLEQMTPLPKTQDDAYRLYDIGVAYEALAYQSEDREAAKKFLQEAAINYGKAVDGKPDEKYFLPPQKRIETAMVYFRKIETLHNEEVRKTEPAPSVPPPPQTPPAPNAGNGSQKTLKKVQPSTTQSSPGTNVNSGAAKAPANPVKTASKPAAPALTNDQVIEMVKAGVPEQTIVGSIQDAPTVDFDMSPPGLVNLAKGGVKSDKILSAMRARAKHHASTTGSS